VIIILFKISVKEIHISGQTSWDWILFWF